MPSSPRRAKPHPESLWIGGLLTALIALGQLATAMYIPSMPSLVADLGTTPQRVTLTLTIFLAGFAVSQLFFGPLSDRYGRRKVLMGGLGLFLCANFACAFAPSIEALLFSRFLQSVGACSGAVLGRAIVRDIYGRERAAKALAYIGVAFSVSPAISPIIGGYLQEWYGWQANFLFLAAVTVVVWATAWFLLEETNRQPDPTALNPYDMARNYALLLRNPIFIGHMLALSLVFSGLMAFIAAAPFLFIETLGIRPAHYGLLSALAVFGTLAGNLSAGVFTMRLGIERMMWIGIGIAVAAGGAMTLLALMGFFGVLVILIPIILFLCGMGIVMPNGMAGAMGPFPRMAGAASALLGFVQMAAGAAAAALGGWLPQDSQLPLACTILALGVSAAIAFAAFRGPATGTGPECPPGARQLPPDHT